MAFGRYSMSGGRFDEAEGLPLAVLGELKNYRDLVVDVAKHLYKREHPRRRNLPSGFERQIDLRISGIEHGCVVVKMTQIRNSDPIQPDLWGEESEFDCVEEARKLINHTIEKMKAKKDPALIGDFPPESLSRLYRVGKYLEDDEKITLAEANNTGRVDVDSEWRSLVANSMESQLKERVVDGKLVGMSNLDEGAFKYEFLVYKTQKTISSKLDISRWDDFFQFFNNRSRAPMCSLSIVCKVDDDNEIVSVEHTYGIEGSLPDRFSARLEELSHLKKGWYDSSDNSLQGEPIADDVFKYVQAFLRAILLIAEKQNSLIDLVIFPQIEGGLQLEWKSLDFEVDFNSDGSIIAYDFGESKDDEEKEFDYSNEPEDIIKWLIGGESND